MVERSRALKLESPISGGQELDNCPTEVDPSEDYLEAAGMVLQAKGATPAQFDEAVRLERDNAGNWQLTDASGAVTNASDVVTKGGRSKHAALVDAIHFLGDGPGDGWPSGAVRADTYSGIFLQSRVWFVDAARLKRITAMDYSYSGALLSQRTLRLYAADGVTVARTVIDAITRTGVLVSQMTRTWT